MIKVIERLSEWKKIRVGRLYAKKTFGLVPTMGALHDGHAALIKKSIKENDITVVSIFVNPTQFNNPEDLKKYPNTFDADLELLNNLKVDFLLHPTYEEMYPYFYDYKVIETNFSKTLCGQFRPGHFDGVLTVVLKLLNLVKPNKAYFGEKDFQQYKLVKGMAEAFFIDTKIISVPTVRTKDGLALSSRNMRLSKDELKTAAYFPQILKLKLSDEKIKSLLEKKGFRVEYIEQIGSRRFGAVYLGNVRLIDNVKI
ncbi:MAG TPA: pantoate--beta-alanine ligase [Ignavibacteriales bacterium]|nr:pantoate--beta-alanine ligase [Ignavibacteriales bacterium]